MSDFPVVVITGSSRGLGFALAREFLQLGCRVVISGKDPQNLANAAAMLQNHSQNLLAVKCDVKNGFDLNTLWDEAVAKFGRVDHWINNAGINGPDLPFVDVPQDAMSEVMQTNLFGMMEGTRTAVVGMSAQPSGGQVWNMEGFGSNEMVRRGMTVYGTTKRALTYFTRAMAEETKGSPVKVGALSPGMMITDFLMKPLQNNPAAERQKRLFNILADKPETVARFLAPRILLNRKNGAHIVWLTNAKAAWRFATAGIFKRDLFGEKKGSGK